MQEKRGFMPMVKERCMGCGLCEALCPFQAIKMENTEEGIKLEIMVTKCQGCGLCSANCPYMSITRYRIPEERLKIYGMEEARIKIITFICRQCSPLELNVPKILEKNFTPGIRVNRTVCLGRLDAVYILEALHSGFDGVIVFGCSPGQCQFSVGNFYADKRLGAIKKLFEIMKIDTKRLSLHWIEEEERKTIPEKTQDFVEEITKIGPLEISEDMKRNLLSAKYTMGSETVRWLIGKEQKLVKEQNVFGKRISGEKFNQVMTDNLTKEYIRYSILLLINENPLTAKEISEKLSIPSSEILKFLAEMKQESQVIRMTKECEIVYLSVMAEEI